MVRFNLSPDLALGVIMSPFTTYTAERAPVISGQDYNGCFIHHHPASGFRKIKQGSEMKCSLHQSFKDIRGKKHRQDR